MEFSRRAGNSRASFTLSAAAWKDFFAGVVPEILAILFSSMI
jgi:hypothetical protein